MRACSAVRSPASRARPVVGCLALVLGLAAGGPTRSQEPATPAPGFATAPIAQPADAPQPSLAGFAELEAAGTVIRAIRVVTRNVFDTDDPKEDYLLFRWANALHIQTRESVIRRALLFKPGDKVSVRVLQETERQLLGYAYLYDVQFRALDHRDGAVDIEVSTRDTWSLDLGLRFSRTGGRTTSGIRIADNNLFGTGTTFGISRDNDVDRSSNEFFFANDRIAGTRVALRLLHASNSDGGADEIVVVRPFYELDARWAAGALASRFDRIDPVYNAGEVVSEYRHRQRRADAFGGRSAGLVDGWVHRYSIGVNAVEDKYATEPGRVPPAQLPADRKLVGPYARYEVVEDRYLREFNRNLIGRPEFFALGLAAKVQLGWAAQSLGSTRDTLLYEGTVSRGFEPAPGQTVMTSGYLTGEFAASDVQRQRLGARAQYYRPQGARWLFYASAAADAIPQPFVEDTLYLGGDNGLRGYPIRYQAGTRRALFTAEERYYTDIYLWQLFRIGAAAFVDIGRAWDGSNVNASNPGWLRDVGLGLRIVTSRSAFGNVVHVDLAFPLNTTPDIDKVQFLVKTKISY